MSASGQDLASELRPHILTLVGPSQRDQRRNLLKLKPWSGAEWRRVVVRIDVGSDKCPTWDDATVLLTAVQDLLKLANGILSDDVINALKTHTTVLSYERFRGPPA